MKISMRVKLAVVVALFAAVFMVGSAWADEASVVQAIQALGLARQASETGNIITVTGTAAINVNTFKGGYETWPIEDPYDANEHVLLQLGDLTGLTIDWKANLTLTGVVNGNAAEGEGIQVIHFINGTFKLTGGKIDIQTTGTGRTHALEGEQAAQVTVDGVTMNGPYSGITADSDNGRGIIVKSGTVSFPNEAAVAAGNVTIEGGTIVGLVAYEVGEKQICEAHGATNTLLESPWADDDGDKPVVIEYIAKSGSTWTVSSDFLIVPSASCTFEVESGGKAIIDGTTPVDNHGTITIKENGVFVNNSTINNFSGNTINNQGTLTNNGTIDNKATGKITNTGTIDNTNGTIKNDGVFQSDQTAEQMGGTVTGNNAVEPIDDTTNPSSGSSGCDAGFGMFALAALALPFMRKK